MVLLNLLLTFKSLRHSYEILIDHSTGLRVTAGFELGNVDRKTMSKDRQPLVFVLNVQSHCPVKCTVSQLQGRLCSLLCRELQITDEAN